MLPLPDISWVLFDFFIFSFSFSSLVIFDSFFMFDFTSDVVFIS